MHDVACRGRVLVLGIIAAVVPPSSARAAEASTEYGLKAAFLHKFLVFSEWSPESRRGDDDMSICVYGPDPFGEAFAPVLGQFIRSKRLSVRHLVRGSPPAALKSCYLAFFSAALGEVTTKSILRALHGSAVLTVGEDDRFLEWGGIVNLLLRGERLRFEVCTVAARRAGVRFRAQMLRLAVRVVSTEAHDGH